VRLHLASLTLAALALLASACHDRPAPRGSAPIPELACAGVTPEWPQFSAGPAHGGATCASGQPLQAILATAIVDEHAAAEEAEADGDLLVHYQTPLLAGDDVVVEHKGGTYVPCSPPGTPGPGCGSSAWDRQVWSERAYRWQGGTLALAWSFDSDWKPPPDGPPLGGWEPVFHAALAGPDRTLVAVPGASGSVHLVDRATGVPVRTAAPLGADPDTFVAGPIAADAAGNAWYTAIRLDPADPWGDSGGDAEGFLCAARVDGSSACASLAALVPGAPAPGDACETAYAGSAERPWPPVDATGAPLPTRTVRCGAQRPQINAAPAIGADGTVFVVTRAHRTSRAGFVVAVRPDLSPRWAAPLARRLADGCGVTVGYGSGDLDCRPGTSRGVDPETNAPPSGRVVDQSTSSPVALPDGGVLYGAFTGYNGARGHVLRFSSEGALVAAFDFGWDVTPAVFPHGGTFSVVTKDNDYAGGGPFRLTQLDASLAREWSFTATETRTCRREAGGTVTCFDDGQHGRGFEWCVNAVAVDRDGVVYANSEDGNLYAIAPGGAVKERILLRETLGAAYTPVSLDASGRIYAQNDGVLFVVGRAP
jgi:outer membrane protein assembly factor BamB